MEARKGVEPDKVIKQMAAEIVPNIQKNDSASLFYGVIDRRNYELRYCSVGSLMGFLQEQGSDNPVQLEPSAGPLKKDFDENPLTHTISLGARDRLILCTEGVWAAQSKNQESFGKERMIKTILQAQRSGVHSVRNEILYQIEKFTDSKEPVRDQTVLVTEVKDKVIKLAKKSSV
jgi:sigma-B regulation protein RsbU (phosphoserine phosphatase)